MKSKVVTQVANMKRTRPTTAQWWRWLLILAWLMVGLGQTPAVHAADDAVTATGAAGDNGWYITTVRSGAKHSPASTPALAIDPVSGKAFISFHEPKYYHLLLAYEQANGNCGNNNGWSCFGVEASGMSNAGGEFSSLAFDPNGNLALLFTKNGGTGYLQLKLYSMSANFGTKAMTIANNSFATPGAAFHSPVIRWRAAVNSMAYIHLSNSQSLDDKQSFFSYSDFATPNSALNHPYRIESRLEGDTYSSNGEHSSLDFAADGLPWIAYRGEETAMELWLTKPKNEPTNCHNEAPFALANAWSCFRIDPTDNTGYFTSIHAPQGNGDFARIAYMDRGNGLLKYAEQVGGNSTCGAGGSPGWKCSVIDDIGIEGRGTQLFVQDGKAVIVYHDANDAGNEKLKIARQVASGESGNCGPTDGLFNSWQCSVIDFGTRFGEATKHVGRRVAAALDKSGRIVAAYTSTDGDLIVAKERFSTGVSLTKNAPATLALGQSATVTYQLHNPNPEPLTELLFMNATQGLVTFSEIVNSCGGVADYAITGLAGPRLRLQGGVIPAQGTCTITAKITGMKEGKWEVSTTNIAAREAVSGIGAKATVTIYTPKQAQSITFAALPDRTFGDAPFTVSAAATSGLPVNFGSTTPGVCTVNGATVTLLAGGTCTIVAAQAGNAQYEPAAPVNRSFTVQAPAGNNNQQAQSITFAALPDRTLGDAPFALNATASSGLPVSYGTLTPGACMVNGNLVTLLSLGQCTIVAGQAGDANWQAAPAVNQSFLILPGAKQNQTITVEPIADQTLVNAAMSVSLKATASSNLPISVASTSPATCAVDNSGEAVQLLAIGACSLLFEQAGDAFYNPATATLTFQILPAAVQDQVLTFAALPDRTLGEAPFALTASASSGLPVSFASATPTVCTVDDANSVMLVATGLCTIVASQSGNAAFNPAPSVSQSFTVNPPSALQNVFLPLVTR